MKTLFAILFPWPLSDHNGHAVWQSVHIGERWNWRSCSFVSHQFLPLIVWYSSTQTDILCLTSWQSCRVLFLCNPSNNSTLCAKTITWCAIFLSWDPLRLASTKPTILKFSSDFWKTSSHSIVPFDITQHLFCTLMHFSNWSRQKQRQSHDNPTKMLLSSSHSVNQATTRSHCSMNFIEGKCSTIICSGLHWKDVCGIGGNKQDIFQCLFSLVSINVSKYDINITPFQSLACPCTINEFDEMIIWLEGFIKVFGMSLVHEYTRSGSRVYKNISGTSLVPSYRVTEKPRWN